GADGEMSRNSGNAYQKDNGAVEKIHVRDRHQTRQRGEADDERCHDNAPQGFIYSGYELQHDTHAANLVGHDSGERDDDSDAAKEFGPPVVSQLQNVGQRELLQAPDTRSEDSHDRNAQPRSRGRPAGGESVASGD